MKKILTVLSYVLIVAVIAGAIGFVAVFTRGGTTDFKTFYAKYNGEIILGDTEMTFKVGDENVFEVGYTFDVVTSEQKDFYVSVVPYITDETDFEFTSDGETVKYSSLADKDASGCFSLEKTETGFTFTVPATVTMRSCLQTLCGSTITVDESVDITDTAYFAIKLTSYNEESVILLPFTVDMTSSGIELSADGELIY